jgi:hypothetical protein
MDGIRIKLNILCDILSEKKSVLQHIRGICENEQYIYQQPYTPEKMIMINGLSVEKQSLVDKVIWNDEVFQKSFDSIKDDFEEQSGQYKDEIRRLQDFIKEVMALDIKIRNIENENKRWIAQERNIGEPLKKQTTLAAKDYILKQYEKNNRKNSG